ncbi:FAD-dependent monooxygenase-like protein 3 [Elsinoe fawcettii]|nr:FAD-dependent monooxygenase-like protein 3 [Elsinoe fawcettii]
MDEFVVCTQPCGDLITKRAAEWGGRLLGHEASDRDSASYGLTMQWASAENDDRIPSEVEQLLLEAGKKAESRGVFNDYIFQYVGSGDGSFRGVDEQTRNKYRAISGKYDPEQIFQKFVPGGFKL